MNIKLIKERKNLLIADQFKELKKKQTISLIFLVISENDLRQ